MKSFFFAVSLVSFIVYRGAKTKVTFEGTWEGAYTLNEKKVDLKIVFGYNKTLELYSSEMNKTDKFTGSYTISNSGKIAISSRWPGKDQIAFSMNGRLSPKRDFVKGGWEAGDYLYAAFSWQNRF